jgi:uncharacterized membrane protein YqiK
MSFLDVFVSNLPFLVTVLILVLVGGYAFWFFFVKNFKKFSTHQIIAISGGVFGNYYDDEEELKRYRYQKGGEAIVNPLTQSCKILPANKIPLEVISTKMRTADDFFITATTVVIFSIDSSSEHSMEIAFESFGHLEGKDINKFKEGVLLLLEPLVSSATSTIIGRLTYDDLKKNEDKFNTEAKNAIEEKFATMGLLITSISLKDDSIEDEKDKSPYEAGLIRIKETEIQTIVNEEKAKSVMREKEIESEKEIRLKEIEHQQYIKQGEIELALKKQEIIQEADTKELESKNNMRIKEIEHQQTIKLREQKLKKEIQEREEKLVLDKQEIAQKAEKEKAESEVDREIRKRKYLEEIEEEEQSHKQLILIQEQELELGNKEFEEKLIQKEQKLELDKIIKEKELELKKVIKEKEFIQELQLREQELQQSRMIVEQELEQKNVIKQKEFEHNMNLKEQELKRVEIQKEQEFVLSSQEEEHRTQLSKLKKDRLEAEQDIIEKEEEHNMKVFRTTQRAKVQVQKEIEEINAEIELKKSEVIKKKSDYELDLEERKLNMKTIDKRGQIEAENQATLYTFLSKIFKENPTIIENSIEKIFGAKGMAGVASGLTKHLGNIESIRIADLGGSGSSAESAVEKYANIPPNILAKFMTRLNALGFGDLLTRFKIGRNSFDNFGDDKISLKDVIFDEKSNTITFDRIFLEKVLDRVGLDKEMIDDLLEEAKNDSNQKV